MPAVPPAIAALAGRTADLAARLERWANIHSGSGHAAGLNRMADALADGFTRAFPAATLERLPAALPKLLPHTVATLRLRLRPAAPRQVLLCGHYDTVYEADDPFQECRWLDKTRLNGPGTADMKGGLVTMLAALQAFEQTPHAAQLGWEVLITPDEETGSRGSVEFLRDAARRNQFGLVYEPARPNGNLVRSRKGTGVFTAVCHGRAAHAAKVPNDGRNAVLALAEFILEASRIPQEMPGVLLNVGNIRGGTAATNVVPHHAESEIDVRITQAADRAPLQARLESLAGAINARDGCQLVLSGGFNRPPKECLPAEEKVFAHWQQAARDLALPSFDWVHTAGGSDGNFLTAAGLPNLDGLGPLGDFLHSDREFCAADTLAPRAQLTALFLHRVAAGEIELPAIPRHGA